jgi:hypothetical protein
LNQIVNSILDGSKDETTEENGLIIEDTFIEPIVIDANELSAKSEPSAHFQIFQLSTPEGFVQTPPVETQPTFAPPQAPVKATPVLAPIQGASRCLDESMLAASSTFLDNPVNFLNLKN